MPTPSEAFATRFREIRAAADAQAEAATQRLPPDLAARVQWCGLSGLSSVREPWAALARRALSPNVFYEPAFALAAAPVFGPNAGAMLIWADAGKQRLLGLFPAELADWRGGFAWPITRAWTHPYAPYGVPLVDRNEASATIGLWLDALSAHPHLPKRVLLPFVPTEGPFAAALAQALAARGLEAARFGAHRRALLAPASDADRPGYLDRALSAKKRKELARQRRRLADAGPLATTFATAPQEVAQALADFMTLEQSGWKGRRGTAAAQEAAVAAFMRDAVKGLAATGQVQIARLAVGGRAIAAGILLRSGAAGWFWKIAYDERAARVSPGVQLAVDLTRAALADRTLAQVDSCATAGHPMIEPLWTERLALADQLIVLRGAATPVRLAETLRRRTRETARALARRLRVSHRGAAAS
ncbi:MAG TPA: GNAT family N-acetyltransferase [Xanthobacteraceae bacterium]|nr:GNAT family N-acetyltransferase [Xanthobacteraceae bacterium]